MSHSTVIKEKLWKANWIHFPLWRGKGWKGHRLGGPSMMPSSPLQTAPWNPGILGADRTKDVLDETPCVTKWAGRAGVSLSTSGLQNGLYGGSGSRGAPPWPLEQGQWNQSKACPAHVWFLKRLLLTEMRNDVNWADAHVLLFWTKTEHVSLLCPLWENLLCECAEHQPLAILCRMGQAGEGSFWNLLSRGWVFSLQRGAERPLPNCLGRLFCSCRPEY